MLLTIIIVASLLINFDVQVEDGWCGIKPLRIDRRGVERMFGSGSADDNGYITYMTKSARVQVIYSTTPCQADSQGRGMFSVPEGTVLRYWVRPLDEPGLKPVKFDKQRFVKDTSGHDLTYKTFISKDLGIRISVEVGEHLNREYIREIDYYPSPKDKIDFSCSRTIDKSKESKNEEWGLACDSCDSPIVWFQ